MNDADLFEDSIEIISRLNTTVLDCKHSTFSTENFRTLNDADLLEDANEINEVLGRSYAVEDDIDEADLDDELAALDEQLAFEAELGDTDAPSYLTDTATPAVAADTPAPAAAEQVDEFGLPMSA